MKPFNVMKAAMMAALQLGLRFSRNPLEEIMAGRAIFHALDARAARNFDPRRWLHEYMATHNEAFITGFERAPQRSANLGYTRRNVRRTTPRVNYRKQNNRVDRALRKFNGAPSATQRFAELEAHGFSLKRDALTGVVA